MVTGTKKRRIKGFEHYYITEKGVVFSELSLLHEHSSLLKSRTDRAGYRTVRLNKEGKTFTRFIHRLVAESFLSVSTNYPVVNHIDGCKTNNIVTNLEFTTHRNNIKHAYDIGLINKELKQFSVKDLTTGQVYKSIKEAAVANKINYSTLKNMLSGRRNNKSNLSLLKP